MKKYRNMWAVSLLIIGTLTIFFTISNFAELELPDALTRVLGVLDLIAVVVLAYTSVKLKIWKKEKED